MEKVTNLKGLFIEQVKDLYNAEKQQLKVLPELLTRAVVEELQQAIDRCITETKEHINRLENIFSNLNITQGGERCEAMEGLIKEALHLAERSSDSEVLDAGIITSLQRINHYEMAGYGSACAFGKELGYNEISETLHKTLEEAKNMDLHLTRIAKECVNERAKVSSV